MNSENIYAKLAEFGRELLDKKTVAEGLPHIAKYAKAVIGAERCSVFVYDEDKNELWTTLADGVEKIIIPSDKGIVGETIDEQKPILENNVYTNPHFLSDIDAQTGYVTHNLITAPIFDSHRDIMGVLELLNKEGGFDEQDMKFMIFFTHYISGFLELIHVYAKQDRESS